MWNYFCHFQSFEGWTPQVYFTPTSNLGASNPWISNAIQARPTFDYHVADLLFLGGNDWRAVPNNKGLPPVINLIQHVRHASDPELRSYLQRPAVRICVSAEVKSCILATGEVNGPVYTICNGLDYSSFPTPLPFSDRPFDILIVGYKNQALIEKVASSLPHCLNVKILAAGIARKEFLANINASKYCVFLPNYTEGFYLPALEAMYMRSLVICPDVHGNRGFCIQGENCFMPHYSPEGISISISEALAIDPAERNRLLSNASTTANRHSIETERAQFETVLRAHF